MTAPVIVSLPHRLTREEAVRRLRTGLETAGTGFADLITIDQKGWTGDRLEFQLRALGQVASGAIEVFDDRIQLELMLPWLLAKFSERLLPVIERQTTLLLEKK